jgi:hypothetical protein
VAQREDVRAGRAEGLRLVGKGLGWPCLQGGDARVRFEDNLAALEMCRSLSGHRRVVFCHGNMGRVSRVLAPLFGSEWTYASLKRGREAAPGQIDLQSMRQAQEALVG